MITVDLPDGSSIDVDTDDEAVAVEAGRKYLAKNAPKPAEAPPVVPQKQGEGTDLATGVAQVGGVMARGALAIPAFVTQALQEAWNASAPAQAAIANALGYENIRPEMLQFDPEHMAIKDLRNLTTRAGVPAGGDIVEAGISALTPVGLGRAAIAQGGKMAAGVGEALAAQPTLQVAGAASAAGAGEAAKEAGAGPVGQAAATLAGAVVPVAAASIPARLAKSAEAKALLAAAPPREMLKAESSKIYNELENSGIRVNQREIGALASDITTTMRKEGYNAKIHPKIGAVIDEFDKAAQMGSATVSEMEILRRVAQGAAKSIEPDEARLGNMIIDKVDDFFETLPPSAFAGTQGNKNAGEMLKQARGLWSRNRKSELIQDAIERAGQQASGLENGIRVQFRQILNNKKKIRGFSKEEREAMQKVVQGSPMANLTKHLGKFGFSEKQAGSMLLGSVGVAGGAALGGAPGAVAVPLTGQIARNAAQRITKSNAELTDAVVRAGRNGKAIVAAYMARVPKKDRKIEELTGLLIKGDRPTMMALQSSQDPIVSRAATAAVILSKIEDENEQ